MSALSAVDWLLWHQNRAGLEAQVRDLKRRRARPHQPEWSHGPHDWALADLRRTLTGLYALRAEARGRLHRWPGPGQSPEEARAAQRGAAEALAQALLAQARARADQGAA